MLSTTVKTTLKLGLLGNFLREFEHNVEIMLSLTLCSLTTETTIVKMSRCTNLL